MSDGLGRLFLETSFPCHQLPLVSASQCNDTSFSSITSLYFLAMYNFISNSIDIDLMEVQDALRSSLKQHSAPVLSFFALSPLHFPHFPVDSILESVFYTA